MYHLGMMKNSALQPINTMSTLILATTIEATSSPPFCSLRFVVIYGGKHQIAKTVY